MSSNGNAAAKAANAATKAAANANAAAKAAKAAANAAERQRLTNEAIARSREKDAEENMHNWTSALRGRENKRFTEAQVAKMAANKAAGGGGTRRRKSRKNRKTRSRR